MTRETSKSKSGLTLQAAPFFFEMQTFTHSTFNNPQILEEILSVQKSLLIDLNDRTLDPHLADHGFLAVRMDVDYLKELLLDPLGKIILVYHQKEIAGYLLLRDVNNFIDWTREKKFHGEWTYETFSANYRKKQILYIDQIGVKTKYAKHRIGSMMIEKAKTYAQEGLIADILFQPFTNKASYSFFSKKEFSQIGIIENNVNPPFKLLYVMLWERT